MEIQYTGDNIKDVLEFCGECIDGYYWSDDLDKPESNTLAFVSWDHLRVPLMMGDYIVPFQMGFILLKNNSNRITRSKQGITYHGTKQSPESQLEAN